MATVLRTILYVGDDKKYWENLVNRITFAYSALDGLEFVMLSRGKGESARSLYQRIINHHPVILYLDFSTDLKFYSRISDFVAREYLYRDVPIVGLIENMEMMKTVVGLRMDFYHIKCGEIHDVIYDPFYVKFPKSVKHPDYAKAKFSHDAEIIDNLIIGYLAPTYLHAESNINFNEGDQVKIKTALPKSILKSENFIVSKKYTNDFHYDFSYGYDLAYVYVDTPEFTSEEQEATNFLDVKKQKMRDYEDDLALGQRKMKEWIQEKMDLSKIKKTKILIVDDKMHIFNDHSDLSKCNLSFRYQMTPEGAVSVIEKMRPHLVVFQCEYEIIEEDNNSSTETGNDEATETVPDRTTLIKILNIESFNQILMKIKSYENYSPYIVVFNLPNMTSAQLQEKYKYGLILVNNSQINYKFVIDLAKMYEQKFDKKFESAIEKKIQDLKKQNPQKYGRLKRADFVEDRYFLGKDQPLAHATFARTVKLVSMTESMVLFCSEFVVEERKSYFLDFPVNMGIHVIPNDDRRPDSLARNLNYYKALIHSVGEEGKKGVRQFINKIFFTALELEREKELEKFKQLNQQASQKKKEEAGEVTPGGNEVPVVEGGNSNLAGGKKAVS